MVNAPYTTTREEGGAREAVGPVIRAKPDSASVPKRVVRYFVDESPVRLVETSVYTGSSDGGHMVLNISRRSSYRCRSRQSESGHGLGIKLSSMFLVER